MLHASQNAAIILLARKGHSHRSISRLTGHDRKTVRKVLRLEVPSSGAPEISNQPLMALRSLLAQPVKSGCLTRLQLAQSLTQPGFAVRTVGAHGRKSLCGEHENFIASKAEQGLAARKIHEALATELQFGGSYYSVRRFLRKLRESKLGGSAPVAARSDSLLAKQSQNWMLRLLQGEIGTEELARPVRMGIASVDTELLVDKIKLLDMLLEKYAGQSCIYFSWDAASWHASKKLYERVEEINSAEYQARHKVPLVKLAPLPSCAQFLNVIESVFSGMAGAIIHNSDYSSVDNCKAAIDLYFEERNKHFEVHPKRAGNKIWGMELVPPEFNESNNCKDPRYRGGPHGSALLLAGRPASARLALGRNTRPLARHGTKPECLAILFDPPPTRAVE